jgi:hypothetical protein
MLIMPIVDEAIERFLLFLKGGKMKNLKNK